MFDQTYSRLTFTTHVSRPPLAGLLKGFLPALFIVLTGMLAVLMGPDKIPQRLTVSTSALIGSVLFHINLTGSIPPLLWLYNWSPSTTKANRHTSPRAEFPAREVKQRFQVAILLDQTQQLFSTAHAEFERSGLPRHWHRLTPNMNQGILGVYYTRAGSVGARTLKPIPQ